jgi:Arc/MetJ-type ribon-helix-helix transcriptional regulator
MNVTLTQEGARLLNELIDCGEFADAADAIENALRALRGRRSDSPAKEPVNSRGSAVLAPVLKCRPEAATVVKLGSWPALVAELRIRNGLWLEEYKGKFGVFSGTNSYVSTIRAAQPIIQKDWANLTKTEARVLLGLIDEGADYGHLGAMGAARTVKHVFLRATPENLEKRQTVHAAINSIMNQPLDASFPRKARRAQEIIREIDGFGTAGSTRLLALARPDSLVSVNGESAAGLAELSGIAPARVKKPAGYEELIEWTMGRPWWSAAAPETLIERDLWSYRAALIDAFVFEGDHFRKHS